MCHRLVLICSCCLALTSIVSCAGRLGEEIGSTTSHDPINFSAPDSIEEYSAMKDLRSGRLAESAAEIKVLGTSQQDMAVAPTSHLPSQLPLKSEKSTPLLPVDGPIGTYKDSLGNTVTEKDRFGTYRDASGQIIMKADGQGAYRDSSGVIIMQKDSAGIYRDGSGQIIMQKDGAGIYRDSNGQIIMQIDGAGIYRDGNGQIIMSQ